MNRFNHDGRRAVRGDIGFEQRANGVQRGFFADAVQRVGERGAEHVARHWAEVILVGQHLAGHRQGHHGAAVEGAIERDDAGAASGGAGDLHGVFQRFGTGVHQHGLALGATHGGEFAELLAQLHVGRVGDHRSAGVHHFLELCFDRRDDFRVAVAQVEHANAARKIDPAVAVGVPQLGVFGALGKLGGRRGGTISHEAVFQVVQFLVRHHRSLYKPPTQTYFSSVNSSNPW